MINITNDPLLNALGWTLLHSLWQGMTVAVMVGILLKQFKGYEATLRYFVGLLGLSIIVFWSVITFKTYYNIPVESPSTLGQGFLLSLDGIGISEIKTDSFWDRLMAPVSSYIEFAIPWFMIFWVAGMVLLGIKNILGLLEIRRLRRSGQQSPDIFFLERLEMLIKRLDLKIPVRLFESKLVKTPMVIGVLKPIILFPVGLVNGLSTKQVEAILLHELAHIKRQDYLINLVQTMLETIFFFNPAVWYISSRIREERENCCDDIAIENESDPMEYARALTLVGSWHTANLAMGIAGSGNQLYGRIKRMFYPTKRTTMKDKIITMVILGITLISLTIYTQSSYTGISENMLADSPSTDPEPAFLTADASGATMTPAMITLLQTDKTKEPLTTDGDDDKDKKKKKASKAELRKELKEKEARIQELENKLNEIEQHRTYRYDRDREREEALKQRDKAREQRERAREQRDNHRHYRLDTPEEREQMMEEFRRDMEELKMELGKEGFNGSFHIDTHEMSEDMLENIEEILDNVDLHLEMIPQMIPSFDINIDIDEEELQRNLDRVQEKMAMQQLEASKAMERVSETIELRAKEIEEQAKVIELRAHEFELKMQEFESRLKKELVKDGIIEDVDEDVNIRISDDKVTIDGKELSEDLRKKYLNLWEEYYDDQDFHLDFNFGSDKK